MFQLLTQPSLSRDVPGVVFIIVLSIALMAYYYARFRRFWIQIIGVYVLLLAFVLLLGIGRHSPASGELDAFFGTLLTLLLILSWINAMLKWSLMLPLGEGLEWAKDQHAQLRAFLGELDWQRPAMLLKLILMLPIAIVLGVFPSKMVDELWFTHRVSDYRLAIASACCLALAYLLRSFGPVYPKKTDTTS
jgi:hypothetical protein